MEHTKGPWSFDREIHWVNHPGEQEVHTGNYEIYSEDGETIIANVNGKIPGGKSNANLLTSAPELLAACKQAIEVFEAMDHDDIVCAIDLRAAIAKAEGR